MGGLNTDKLRRGSSGSRPVVTTLSLPMANSDLSATISDSTGWNNITGLDVTIFRKDPTTGLKISSSQTDWVATLTGNVISNMVLRAGTVPAAGYAADSLTVVKCGPNAAYADDLFTWGNAHANQDGSLKTAAVQTALGLGASSLNGWNALAFVPNTVTYLGNRSYQCVINGQDLTSTLSAATRLRFTRTVASPTQATLLNGSNQYWSKTTPANMAQTDNISLGGWVKPTAYQNSHIIAKTATAGTDGWRLYIGSDGRLVVNGNGRFATANPSLPINRWSHVVATLAFASNTVIFYVDGIAVASSTLSGAGTITSAGNLFVGSRDSGAEPFAGELDQVFMASKVLSAAEVKAIYSQGLTVADMTTYSIVSAYSFNGNANDINTTNANNLTANNGASATTADSFAGLQADGTISSTLDYGIIMKSTFSTNTTLIVQVPEGCTIPTTGGITAVAYSANKAPYGMPVQRSKWTLFSILWGTNIVTAGGVSGVWYNPNSFQINAPIGEWFARLRQSVGASQGSANTITLKATLSTSSSALGELKFLANSENTNITSYTAELTSEDNVSLAAATPLYGLMWISTGAATTQVALRTDYAPAIISLENAYL